MKCETFKRVLSTYGLATEPGKGGETRVIVAETGDLIYARLSLRTKDVTLAGMNGVLKGCTRKGIPFPTIEDLNKGTWEPAKPKVAEAPDSEIPVVSDATFRTVSELAEEVNIEADWLRHTLPRELPGEAFWNADPNYVDYDMFCTWFTNEKIDYLSQIVVEARKCTGREAQAIAASLRTGKHVHAIPGRRGKHRVWMGRRDEVVAALKLPRSRKLPVQAVPPAPTVTRELPPGMRGRFAQTKHETTRMTPVKAKQILETQNTAIGQRPFDSGIYTRLCRDAKCGLLFSGNIHFGRYPDGSMKLADGQHYLAALAATGLSKTTSITIHTVQDDRDMLELCMRFNSAGSVKSQSLHNQASGQLAGTPCKAKHLNRLEGALNAFLHNVNRDTGAYLFTHGKSSPDARASVLFQEAGFWPVIEWAGKLYDQCWNKLVLQKRPAMVAMVWQWHIDPTAADVFWRPIITGVGFEARDPRKVAYKFLTEYTSTEGGSRPGKRATRHEVFYTVNALWNAFRKGKSVQRIQVAQDPTIPK